LAGIFKKSEHKKRVSCKIAYIILFRKCHTILVQ
jgi:hypothetical protein